MRELRVRPVVLRDLMDDIAVEIDLERRRRGLTVSGICRACGWVSKSRHDDVGRYLRGDDHRLGVEAVCRIAEHLRIPVRFVCGDEADPEPRIVEVVREIVREVRVEVTVPAARRASRQLPPPAQLPLFAGVAA